MKTLRRKNNEVGRGSVLFCVSLWLCFCLIPAFGHPPDNGDRAESQRNVPENVKIGELKEKPPNFQPPLDNWPRWRKWGEPVQGLPYWNRSRSTLPPWYAYSPPGYEDVPMIQRYADAIFVSIMLGIFIAYIVGRIVVSGNPAVLMSDGISLQEHRMALIKAASVVMISFLVSVGTVILYGYRYDQYLYPVSFQYFYFDLLWVLAPGIGLVVGTWLARRAYYYSILNAIKRHL